MRTLRFSGSSVLLLIAGGIAGCSLAYNGSRFQGGSTTDTGVPTDTGTPTDTGAPTDTGVPTDTNMSIDMGSDTGPVSCSTSSECGAAEFCKAGTCTACDGDGDGWVTNGATTNNDLMRCMSIARFAGTGDCDDTDSHRHPMNRADCSTSLVESCDLPFTLPTPMSAPIREIGVTPEHVLYRETTAGAMRIGLRRLGLTAGDDAPSLPDGTKGGFVALALGDPRATTGVYFVPLTFDGGEGTPQVFYGTGPILDFAVGSTIEGTAPYTAVGIALGPAETVYAQAPYGAPFNTPTRVALPSMTTFVGDSTNPAAVAVADWVNHAAAATILTSPSTGVYLANFSGSGLGHSTGGANVVNGTWLAGAGAAIMWAADMSHVGVWNGADAAISPPLVDLSPFISTGGPTMGVLPAGRGSVAVRYSSVGGVITENVLAAVPIGDTTTNPHGRIALLRWTLPRPSGSTDRTDAYVPGTVRGSELVTTGAIHALAGTALIDISDDTAMIAYQDGNQVMVRPLFFAGGAGADDPPTLAMFDIAPTEVVQAIAIQKGGWMSDPVNAGGPVGRLVVAILVRTAMGSEVRVRALEGCL